MKYTKGVHNLAAISVFFALCAHFWLICASKRKLDVQENVPVSQITTVYAGLQNAYKTLEECRLSTCNSYEQLSGQRKV